MYIFVHFEKGNNVLLRQIKEASFSFVEHNMTNVTENFVAHHEANNLCQIRDYKIKYSRASHSADFGDKKNNCILKTE